MHLRNADNTGYSYGVNMHEKDVLEQHCQLSGRNCNWKYYTRLFRLNRKKIEKLFIKNRFSMTGFTRFTLLELFCSKISLNGSSTKIWKTCQLIFYYFVTFLFLEIEVFLQFICLNKKIFEKGLQFHENLTNGFREDFLEF